MVKRRTWRSGLGSRFLLPFAVAVLRAADVRVVVEVREWGTMAPVPGAQVQTEWVEVELHNAMRRNPRSATTRTLASGAYVLCFVPTDISTELRASRDSARTGPVEIFLNDRVVLRRDYNPEQVVPPVCGASLSVDKLKFAKEVA